MVDPQSSSSVPSMPSEGSVEVALATAVEQRIQRVVAPDVRALTPYHVADAKGLIKLDAMENPYPWPAELRERWLAKLRDVALNRYPDPTAARLRNALIAKLGVPKNMAVMLGNGSDELIQLLAMSLGGGRRTVMAPEPSFSMYRVISLALGLHYRPFELNALDFSLPISQVVSAIRLDQPDLTFLAFPNNPTGNLFDRTGVDTILRESTGLVVIDEAYAPFAGDSYIGALLEHPNLLILRTLSKVGLAGLRLGILVGHPLWINELDKLRLPYNINVLSQASALFALDHYEVFERQAEQIRADREYLLDGLRSLELPRVWQSHANFILFRVADGRADHTMRHLRNQGVLIKSFDGSNPLLNDCLRVTVGTRTENSVFLEALRGSLNTA